MSQPYKAFTIEANGLLPVLKTDVQITIGFAKDQKPPNVKPLVIQGIWDTGATGTSITKEAANFLGLKPVRKIKTHHANGESVVDVYLVNVYLPNGVGFSMVPVSECKLPNGVDMLIGMDIITTGDFSLTNYKDKTMFSFRVPSVKHIDFVATSNTSTRKQQRQNLYKGKVKKR